MLLPPGPSLGQRRVSASRLRCIPHLMAPITHCRPAAHCHLSPFPSTRLQTSYTGASLLAMSDLGRRLGYTLVGADRAGINAFFVRTNILECQGMQVG
jgi:hypothetical protein